MYPYSYGPSANSQHPKDQQVGPQHYSQSNPKAKDVQNPHQMMYGYPPPYGGANLSVPVFTPPIYSQQSKTSPNEFESSLHLSQNQIPTPNTNASFFDMKKIPEQHIDQIQDPRYFEMGYAPRQSEPRDLANQQNMEALLPNKVYQSPASLPKSNNSQSYSSENQSLNLPGGMQAYQQHYVQYNQNLYGYHGSGYANPMMGHP